MTQATTIDRATASRINPLISQFTTEDTLIHVSRLVVDIAYFLSLIEPHEDSGPHLGTMYLVFEPIAAALNYEIDNPKLARKKTKEENGDE
jgi:hypothetical protein